MASSLSNSAVILRAHAAGVRAAPSAALSRASPAAPARAHAVATMRSSVASRFAMSQRCAARPAARARRVVVRAEADVVGTGALQKLPAEDQKILKDMGKGVEPNLSNASIYLTGMMGCGKSTVGKLVADALGYMYFDSDLVVEQLTGKSVAEFFAEDGEEAFRDIEAQVLGELSSYTRCVVATGGGAVTTSRNWGAMHTGVSVYLETPVEVLKGRVEADGVDKRPLLAEGGSLEDIMAKRLEFYTMSDGKVMTTNEEGAGASPETVAGRVLFEVSRLLREGAEVKERQRRSAPDKIQEMKRSAGDATPYQPWGEGPSP